MDNLIHIRALEEFGRGYGNPRSLEKLLRAVFERFDKDEAKVAELKGERDAARSGESDQRRTCGETQSSLDAANRRCHASEAQLFELKQLMGGAIIRLQELGDTEFKLPDPSGEVGRNGID